MDSPAVTVFAEWERLLTQFDRLSRSLASNQASADEVDPFYEGMRGLVDVDADVALFNCIRHDARRFALYPLTQAMNSAVLGILTARQLGWSPERVKSLGCAALTMNLSILDLQADMAERSEPPSSSEMDEIRAHPEASAALLRTAGVVDPLWLAIVATHHEQPGGAGYPQGLVEVSEEARLLRVIDVLMAKLSGRASRAPMVPQAAVRQLFQQNSYDTLALAVIKTLGVHPPGSLVKLRSGEVAVTIRRAPSGPNPLVATLSDRRGEPLPQTHRRNTAEAEFGVVGPLTDTRKFASVLPERVYGTIAR